MKITYTKSYLLFVCLFLPAVLFSQTILYVDSSATGANNGTSWQNAYNNLDSALRKARILQNVDTIKVAKGTYKPSLYPDSSVTVNPRDVSFQLAFSGTLEGGYASGGTAWDSKRYPTILSGDIGQPGVSSDNAYHVLMITEEDGELRGLTITGGNADGADSLAIGRRKIARASGGGVYVAAGYTYLKEVIAEENHAELGGALFNNAVEVFIENTIVTQNTAYRGGAIFNARFSAAYFTNLVAFRNVAEDAGGAIVNDRTMEYKIEHCSFVGNSIAGALGGAIYNTTNSASSKIANTLFDGNYVFGDSTLIRLDGDDFVDSTNAASVEFCVLQSQINSPNNYTVDDAQLVDPTHPRGADDLWATADDGLAITVNSQAFKNGGGYAMANDITGVERNNSAFDIGAYEIDPCRLLTARTVYVDSSASGRKTGASWADALTSLQGAINLAQFGCVDTIKIAKGTYMPSNYLRNASGNFTTEWFVFQLPSHVALLGGYAQGGSASANPKTNKTILTNPTGRVFFAGNVTNILLDGLVVQQGSTKGTSSDIFTVKGKNYPSALGGGLLVQNAEVTIRRCTIRNNSTTFNGGGLAASNSLIKMDSCVIEENTSPWKAGGVYIDNASAGSFIQNTTLQNNSAVYYGGGMFIENSMTGMTIRNCRFMANKTLYAGGNSAGGGALFSDYNTHLTITGSKFAFNKTEGYGGALRIDNNSYSYVFNSFFTNNSSIRNGGAVYHNGRQAKFYNCIFSENTAATYGGGIFTAFFPAEIVFCDFIRNQAGARGGGVDGEGNVTNSIFWRNSIANDSTAATADIYGAVAQNSCLQITASGIRNIVGADPLFYNSNDLAGPDNLLGTADDGLRLKLQSPLLNEGQSAYDTSVLKSDVTGVQRRLSSYPDMGPYEADFCALSGFTNKTIYVDSAAISGDHSGRDWSNAFTNLEGALRAIRAGCSADTIKIAKGKYIPNAVPGFSPYHANDPSDFAFSLPSNVVVMGGYSSGGGERDFRKYATVLSGFSTAPLYLTLHVVLISNKSNIVLDGLRIEDGSANGLSGSHIIEEEGIKTGFGGALYVNYSTLSLKNTVIQNNKLSIYLNQSQGRFINCVIANNYGPDFSAGITSYSSPFEYVNCVFSKNRTYGLAGGAVHIAAPDKLPSFKNCTFYGNSASLGGAIGAGYMPYISNCLFWNNKATSYLVPERASENELSLADLADSNKISYSLFQYKPYQYKGLNCLYGLSPVFVDSANGAGADKNWGTMDDGLQQTGSSYAINHGHNAFIPVDITTDITGAPRINSGMVDIGAYEYNCGFNGFTNRLVPVGTAEMVSNVFNSCGTWQFRSSVNDASKYILEIDPNGNDNFNPSLIKIDVTNTQKHVNTNGSGDTVALAYRMVSINAPGTYIANGGIKLRIYYDPAELNALPGMTKYWFKHKAQDKMTVLTDLGLDSLANAQRIIPAATGTVNGIPYVEFHNITSFSTFGYTGVSHLKTLPVQFLSFTVKWMDGEKAISVDWHATEEEETEAYVVERSSDGRSWSSLMSMNPVRTNGIYNWIDHQPLTGLSYYRIKTVNQNGKTVFSVIRMVTTSESKGFTLAPNPVKNLVQVRLNKMTPVVNYLLTDMAGRIVAKGRFYNQNGFSLSFSNQPAGFYTLTVNQKSQKLYVVK